ncbi:MAG TPA: tripartite tricarboxylate transporter permease [bacterium]|nr:tripartite tricarboxylate transporter permease [bacterium]
MLFHNIAVAFETVFALQNLLLMTAGVLAGIVAAAIPGITITLAIILTLPFTFGMTPIQGISTMIGVYVGGLSGGLLAGILIGIPGTPASVATTFDGFPMARQGRPGLALGIGVWASFFGGLISAVTLMVFAPVLGRLGLEFGPWDFFALIFFALTIIASLSGESMLKGGIAGLMGLLLACVGEEPVNGIARLNFGMDALRQGFDFLPVLVGLFAFSQLMSDIEDPASAKEALIETHARAVKIQHRQAIREIMQRPLALLRASAIGIFIGLLPAAGESISNILSYDQAKKASKHPEKFGTGIPEGIIASEASNNATAGGALTMMMALGIPGDLVTAIMLGALLIHNLAPSPTFITEQPVLSYGIFVSFFLAHFIMIAVQSLGLRFFLRLSRVPKYVLAAVIFLFCAVGVFALNNIMFDVWTLFFFGVLGYQMRVFGFPLAPMVLGVILGPIAEVNLSRAMAISWDPVLFLVRPWSLFFLTLAVLSLIFPYWQRAVRTPGAYWLWRYYLPVSFMLMGIPLLRMPGYLRPALAVGLIAFGLWRLVREWRDAAMA